MRSSSSIFADRKRSIRDYLLAIAIFTNGAKGHSALQLSRDLDCQYKTAFVLAHKLREVIEAEQCNAEFAGGEYAIDGAYFGGHVKPQNEIAKRVDRRAAEEQTGKRQVVVVMREHNGRTLPFVCTRPQTPNKPRMARLLATERPMKNDHVMSGPWLSGRRSPAKLK